MQLLCATLILLCSFLVESVPENYIKHEFSDHLEITNITKKEGHIGGGRNAYEGQFPWQVAIFNYYRGELNFDCGGSIISKEWVLTAAHCIKGRNEWTLYFGSIYKNEGIKQVSSFAIMHERYYADERIVVNDIGLIEIPQPLTFTANIQPISLAQNVLGNLDGETVLISGFGRISRVIKKVAIQLKYAEFTVDNKQCYNQNKAPESILCTASPDHIFPCNGDSGGPVVYKEHSNKWVLVGVVSYGSKGCKPPHVQMRVPYFLDWIERKTGIHA